MIEFVPNKYENNLLKHFWTYKPKEERDEKVYALLYKVCRAWVIDRTDKSEHDIGEDSEK